MQDITIVVEKEDALAAQGHHGDCRKCTLAQALMRHGYADLVVGFRNVWMYGLGDYRLSPKGVTIVALDTGSLHKKTGMELLHAELPATVTLTRVGP
ncbi:MAG: hypothetical protein LC723_12205 [Actinobacteria bacterium]|nr:hypothetical protein [Actinomycetota bacterium]